MSGRFLVVGDLMTDVIASVTDPLALGSDTSARVATRQGGAGANVAAWLAAMGEAVTFVGVAGDDPFGREAEAALLAAGVDARVRLTDDAATGTCVVLVGHDGDRTMLPDAGANSMLRPEDLPADIVRSAFHVHVSGYSLLNPGSRDAAEQALRLAREAGVPTSVDPASAAPLEAVGGPEFLAMTEGVDLVLVTLDEAEVLCGSRVPGVVGARLTATYDEVVLKLGPDGALWCSRAVPSGVTGPAADPDGPVVDTTGAGDAFAAAWLAARGNDERPEQALRTATRAAASVVTRLGARP
ncbi:MAG: carbohydrate kinase family protein [Actinomycetales bacterium]